MKTPNSGQRRTPAAFIREIPELIYLNFLVLKLEFQCFVLRRKCGQLGAENRQLRLQLGDTLAQDHCRTVLVDPLFKQAEHGADLGGSDSSRQSQI